MEATLPSWKPLQIQISGSQHIHTQVLFTGLAASGGRRVTNSNFEQIKLQDSWGIVFYTTGAPGSRVSLQQGCAKTAKRLETGLSSSFPLRTHWSIQEDKAPDPSPQSKHWPHAHLHHSWQPCSASGPRTGHCVPGAGRGGGAGSATLGTGSGLQVSPGPQLELPRTWLQSPSSRAAGPTSGRPKAKWNQC